ncbi:PLANT INVERTASE/PECTIN METHYLESTERASE INHIBITOR SUPERFAMILY PROTEIN [Salix purpurea]|uniref:PLANT INVERTASE/PECTIN METHYLESTERASE INHIBITOR SUPERFAMILY PROTEIN n=1 Tax=Salix purpurea TaxID=77065 RepID=A0A9Q0W8N6_SALPP|nr:PLANT INVERTASE/PECTIN METHYLESTERASE INHIBITOR SUPERFAMILY PROTEIN [Salix purpurea]
MDSRNRIVIFAAIVLYLFLHFPSQTEAGVELASKVCKNSQNFESCVQTLTSYPQIVAAPDEKAIAEKALELARKESEGFKRGLQGGTASLDVHYALDEVDQCQDALSSGNVLIDSATSVIQKWKTVYDAAAATVSALEH